jgi:Zn-dependent protease/CBS domain-containing protein
MRQSIRLGKIRGIPIGAHWSVVIITALLADGLYHGILPSAAPGASATVYGTVAIAVAVLFLACLLVHEISHALVARHYGVGVSRITLWLLGGVSELESQAPNPRVELFIAGAGPLSSLILGGVSAGLAAVADAAGAPRVLLVALLWLAGVNLVLGLFNLLPGAPLDGGRVLRAILWRIRGDKDAAQISADRAGVALGLLLVIGGAAEILFAADLSGLWLVLLGWFLMSAAAAETANVRMHAALDGRRVRDVMASDVVCGYDGQTVDVFVEQVAQRHRHRVYPVVDLDGRLTGLVTLAQLVGIPIEQRPARRLRDVATPASRLRIIDADEPVCEALAALTPWSTVAPVMSGGRLAGILTRSDVARAIELSALAGAGANGVAAPRDPLMK